MSHFTVLVIGEDPQVQMDPFDENASVLPYWKLEAETPASFWGTDTWIKAGKLPAEPTMEQLLACIITEYGEEEDRYKIEDGKLYEQSTYNPQSQWDWYQIGGRWRGFFTLKPGVSVGAATKPPSGFWTDPPDPAVTQIGKHDGTQAALLGTPGTGEILAARDEGPDSLRKNYSGTADQARKSDIDFDMMKVMAGAEAQAEYDKFTKVTRDLECPGRWKDHFNATIGDFAEREWKDLTDEEQEELHKLRAKAHETWSATPWQKALRENDLNLFMEDEFQYYCLDQDNPREVFIERAMDRIYSPFALVKDSTWRSKGDMGMWGLAYEEEDQTTWNKKVRELIESLPDDTLLTLFDCHI